MRDFTDVTILLDRSGSMNTIREGTIAGINNFINEQKAIPGDGCWTLFDFDDAWEAHRAREQFPRPVFQQIPQAHVPLLTWDTFVPRGMTALNDALCAVIDATGARLAAMPEHMRPNRVVFVIMTDGQENHSTYDRTGAIARGKIALQQSKYNWQFVYLGANQDAKAVAASYAIPTNAAMTYQATNQGAIYAHASASAGLRSWKAGGTNEELHIDPKPPEGTTLPGQQ